MSGTVFSLTLLKIFAIFYTTFSLFGDEAQYWFWSKDLDFGYFSKPPLIAWIIHLYIIFFGDSFESIKLFPIFFYFITSVSIYVFCKKLNFTKPLALTCALSFLISPAVSISSFLVSTDVILLLFWTLSLSALIDIKKDPSIVNFIILGIMLGLAFLAKYAAIYFVFGLILLLLFENKLGNIFLKYKRGFLLFVLTTLIILAPNIIWNYNYGWLTFGHTAENASLNKINVNLFGGMKFFVSQIIMVGPIVFFAFFYYLKKNIKINFVTKFLICFWAPSFFIVLVESLLVRAHANWAAVSLISLLILIVGTIHKLNKNILFINNYANLFVGIIFFLSIGLSFSSKVFGPISGIDDLLNIIQANKSNHKNTLVVGDRMLFANLSYEFFETDTKLYSPYSPGSKIAHHFQLQNPLPSDYKNNFILIGYEDEISYLKSAYTKKLLINKNFSFTNNVLRIYEITF